MYRPPPRLRRCCPVLALCLLALAAAPALAVNRPGPILFASDRGGQSDLWLMLADGSWPANLTNDAAKDDFPAWSADGRRIAWTKGGTGPEGEIWVMDADGSNAHQLTFNKFSDLQATWSPDGRQIAFCSLRRDNRDIYLIDVDGKNERRLTNDPANDFAPDWSPDGARIAWTSERSGHMAVLTMKVDGSDVRQVTPDSLEAGFPGWSPDGTRIVFTDALCGTCAASDLWVVNADGSGLRQITDTPTNELAKSWSFDGKSVVGDFSKLGRSGPHDVAFWDVATGAVTMLTHSEGSDDAQPDWSPVPQPSAPPRLVADPAARKSAPGELQPSDNAPWARVGGGVAKIEYDLPKAGHVRVRVYDESGREVARPVDEWQSQGHHQTSFAFGASPNQVFRYRVECGSRRTSGTIETGP